MLKADFHGCAMTGEAGVVSEVMCAYLLGVSSFVVVCRSKCKSYVGLHGIMIQETQNTFRLICKDDKIRSELTTSCASMCFNIASDY